MSNDDVIMSNDDENAVKTVSKCLARMKGCWDPEFVFSSELAFRAGGFPHTV